MKKIMSLVLTVCAALAAQAQSPAPSVTVNGVQYVLPTTNQPASVGVYVATNLPALAPLAPAVPGYSVPSGYTLVPNGAIAAGTVSNSTMVPTPQSFVSTVETYFSSFNTNLQTFSTNSPYEIWSGASWQAGINLGAAVGVEAEPFKAAPGLMLGEVTTFAGVVGSIAQEEIDFGWALRHYDVQAVFGLCGADQFHVVNSNPSSLKGGFFVEAEKAATDNTFYGMRLNEFIGLHGHGQQPPLTIFAGFTF